jgi:hypothetical protein
MIVPSYYLHDVPRLPHPPHLLSLPSRAFVVLMCLAACACGPPSFQVEPRADDAPRPNAESLSIGSPSTPPPGEYRFVRLYADGSVEVREVFTSNGPGPWLSLIGRESVSPSVVHAALTAAASPDAAPEDARPPCVLAVDSGATRWQGCRHHSLAARLLSLIPRLTLPDATANCELDACQLRLVREVPPAQHARYGDLRQDRVLDHAGVFWCAGKHDPQASQFATLRVERGRIREADALRLFRWVLGPIGTDSVAPERSGDLPLDRVLVRRRTGDWTPVPPADARGISERWDQIAARLPLECRSIR